MKSSSDLSPKTLRNHKRRKIGVDIVGFGPIGRRLAELLVADEELRRMFRISSISDSSGAFLPKRSSEVLSAVEQKASGRKRIADIEGALSGSMILDSDSPGESVLCDVTNSDYSKSGEAMERARGALRSGKHFVSANKVALSYYFPKIIRYAETRGLFIGYGASICGGRNAISIAENIGQDREVTSAQAVLNASTTLILSSLEERRKKPGDRRISFDEACERAAKAGVLESNWSVDLDGIDAAAKTAILSNVLFPRSRATFPKVKRSGIRSESAKALLGSKRAKSGVVRLVSKINPSKCQVSPEVLAMGDPLAVEGRFNAVTLQTKSLGEISVRNLGGGVDLTAHVLISDLEKIVKRDATD